MCGLSRGRTLGISLVYVERSWSKVDRGRMHIHVVYKDVRTTNVISAKTLIFRVYALYNIIKSKVLASLVASTVQKP